MASITLPVGTKVRTPDGREGVIVEARNTIWQFSRRVSEDGSVLWTRCKWYPVQQLQEVK